MSRADITIAYIRKGESKAKLSFDCDPLNNHEIK